MRSDRRRKEIRNPKSETNSNQETTKDAKHTKTRISFRVFRVFRGFLITLTSFVTNPMRTMVILAVAPILFFVGVRTTKAMVGPRSLRDLVPPYGYA
jgi:hypothetical protein